MPSPDKFPGSAWADLASFSEGFAITPNDSTDLPFATRGLMVTTAGDLDVMTQSGVTIRIPAAQPGQVYPHKVCRVLTTSTATGIWGYL